MPVELHFHTAVPLNDGVPANRVLKGFNNHLRTTLPGSLDGIVHIGDQITSALLPKWKRYRRPESEYRKHAYWRRH